LSAQRLPAQIFARQCACMQAGFQAAVLYANGAELRIFARGMAQHQTPAAVRGLGFN
jgi:hypothetical protein